MKNVLHNSIIGALFICSVSAFAAPTPWNGTADVSWFESSAQAYNLINAEQLAGLAKLVNDGTCDFAGKTITLGADIFLNDTIGADAGSWYNISHRSWTPIGTTSRPFKGEFDGIAGKKNRKIYGLYINSSSTNYAGLFGYTNNVKISNLDVLVGKIVAKDNVGSLIGYAEGGSVTNVHAEARVNGNNRVGGLIGYYTGSISKSSEKGNVTGRDSVGGIVGITTGSITGTSAVNSYFIGNVNGRNYVGGIAGSSEKISKTYTKATVSGDSSYVGGVAGLANGLVDSVYHTAGLVKGYSFVGGIVGCSLDSVKYSFSEGDVFGTGNRVGGAVGSLGGVTLTSPGKGVVGIYAKGNVNGSSYVGGVLGYVGGMIDSSYHSDGNVNGSDRVGGVVGYVWGPLKNSYSEGNVTGTGSYVGGVAGYASGKIDSSYHINGNIIGTGSYIGGVVGFVSDDVTLAYHNDGYINGSSYVGGLIGRSEKNVINSFSNGNVTGTSDYVGGLIGLSFRKANTTKNMLADTTFIKNSYSVGDVEGRQFVGGLIGLDSIYKAVLIHSNSCSYDPNTKVHVCYPFNDTISNNKISPKIVRIVKDSYSKGAVNGTSKVGGLIGTQEIGGDSTKYISSAYRSFEIRSSYHSDGSVTGRSNYVGGIIGYSIGMIDSSYYAGGVISGYSYVGGLAGLVDSNVISRSHSEGYVNGGGSYVGGAVGHIVGSISEVYHTTGSVASNGSYVGGLAGYMSGSIVSSYHENGNVSGKDFIGGLSGICDSNIVNSHAKANITSSANYVGGLIGLSVRRLNTTNGVKNDSTFVKNSYFVGNVEGKKYVGGLIGVDSVYKMLDKLTSNSIHCYIKNQTRVCDTTFTNNPSSKLIKRNMVNSYSKGNVKGLDYVGGLIGSQSIGSDSTAYLSSGYILFSVRSSNHSDGPVEGDSSYVGGIIGQSNGLVEDTYHIGGNVKGKSFVGGLIGWTSNSVRKSHSEGNVFATHNDVGGLVGYSQGAIDSSFHINGDVNGARLVGGLTGECWNNITNSYSEGNVSGTGNYVGGLSAKNIGKIENSYYSGDVLGVDSVGGLAGYVGAAITASYAKGTFVKGRNTIGGLVGVVKESISAVHFEGDSVTGIYQVGGLAGYAAKTVDGSYSTANVKGDDNVGGLIGSAYGNISNSYATGNVIGDVEHSSAGNDNLGGLVGYQYSGSVSKSLALGDIYGTTKLGGLVGRFEGSRILQSYANGNVTGDYYGDPADEVGNYYIGGLVGYAKGIINESYASGIVKGIEDEPVYTGCIVGYVSSSLSVTKTYYDKSKCGLGIDGGENSASVTGSPDKTTAEMQTQSTFANWDFTDTWMIMENTYPFLQLFANSLLNATIAMESLENKVYNGVAKTPQVTEVSLLGNTLLEGTDYSITYDNNINAGTARINICGKGLYNGCKTILFEIAPAAIEPTIAAIDNATYSGLAINPEILVYNGETLLNPSDYAVEYSNNINVGTATVSVTMKGNYSGSATQTFKIEKATPVVTQNPIASDVIIGNALVLSNLTAGSANVQGTFAWKFPEIIPTLENEGYTVIFTPNDDANYSSVEVIVPIKVWDIAYVAVHVGERTLDSVVVIKGSGYTLPNNPDSVGYDFVGYYNGNTAIGNPGDEIAINENTVVSAKYAIQIFTVNFVNNGVELQTNEMAYGTLPNYSGETPIKVATAQYTYTFKEWNPAIETVTSAATYTAVFDSVVNKYVITFMDGEAELQSGEVAYGVEPTPPTVLLPENTAQYTYSFGGWDKEVVAVTGTATYTAIVNRALNKYEVAFKDFDGTILKNAVDYDYGTSADDIEKPSTPTRGNTAQYTYAFKGWNPAITEVTENAQYVAEYDSTLRSYTITFKNGSEELQASDVDYGATPIYEGNLPIKVSTDQYTYTFKGWSPAITSVTRAATYTAIFDSVINKYVITFMNGNTELQSGEVAYGEVPTPPTVALPENSAQYTYSFGGWDKEVIAVTGTATYTAIVYRALNKYEVAFKDFDGTILKNAVDYDYGTSAEDIEKPSIPTRGNTAQYTYAFKDWKPAITEVTENVEYVAEYDSTLRSYTITFKNGTEELQASDVDYGVTPIYEGNLPTKISTDQYTYAFKGWSPAITFVTRAATYYAIFDSVTNKYVITFMNGNTKLQSSEIAYGVTPTPPTVTLPENTAQYTYSFGGWDKEVVAVTGTATYTAIVNRTLNKYEVAFKDFDGTVLKNAMEYNYGTSADDIEKPSTPTRGNTAQYTYAFKGWNPAITEVTENAEYVAEYDSTIRSYTIAFVNGSDELQSGEVEYGVTPSYKGDVPTKASSAQYTYTFKGWTPAITFATRSATYTAEFDSVVNEYVITFMDGETELQSGEVAYGVVPTAPEVTLPENTAQYTYSFGGWNKAIVAVTGTATYTAIINKTLNEYSVSFRDYNGDALKGSVSYTFGTSASDISKPSNPTRTSTAQYAYSFKDWNPMVSDVTEDVVYVAEYDSTVRSYTISFVNGSVTLQSDVLEYGSMPSYEGDVPTKAASAKYTYAFASWSPTITSVTGAVTYKAVFDSIEIVVSSSSVTESSSSVKQSSSSEYSSSSSGTAVSSSSKTESSSSVARLSSSSKIEFSSSSSTGKSSSSKGNVPIAMQNEVPHFSVTAGFRNVQIAGAKVGSTYALLDLQGRVLQKGRVESANFNIAVPQSGSYLVRINKQTTRIDVK